MRRALSFLSALWSCRHGRVTLPRLLTYVVTFACNARCVMCDSWRKVSNDELGLGEIDRIFSHLPRMDVVRLTGGEPFLRRDILEIAHLVQQNLRPLMIHVTTNGFLTDRIIRFCEDRDKGVPLYLLASVDGMRDKHNQIRGRKDAWDSVVRTIRALAPRQKALRLSLSVNQTIVDAEGLEHYERLRDFLKPLGIRNHVVVAYDVSATYHVQTEVDVAPTEAGEFATLGRFTDEQMRALVETVRKDMKRYPWLHGLVKRYYLDGIESRILGGVGHPNPPCVALNAHLRLLPNGLIPTCQFNTTTVGDLRHQRFEEIWAGALIQRQRDWVRRCPGCWAECEVLPNAVYTGDLARTFLLFQLSRIGDVIPEFLCHHAKA